MLLSRFKKLVAILNVFFVCAILLWLVSCRNEKNGKKVPIYEVPISLQATYGQTLGDVSLPDGFNFEDDLMTFVGDVGINKFKVTYTPDDLNKYEIVTGIEVSIEVNRAENEFISNNLSILGWTYGSTSNSPSGLEAKFGVVSYMYSDIETGEYESIVPMSVGTYYVKGFVNGTINYTSLVSEAVSFNVSKFENNFIQDNLIIEDWSFGETPNKPTGLIAKHGMIEYRYSSEENGVYTSTVPTHAGTYYVKGFVEGTVDYSGLESEARKFVIKRSVNEFISSEFSINDCVYGECKEPTGLVSKYGDVVYKYSSSIDGEFTLLDGQLDVGTYYVKGFVEETVDYTGLVTLEIKMFTVRKAVNEFVNSDFSIDGWVYGDEPNEPKGLVAKFGVVVYMYSNEENGVYTLSIPEDAGVYYVKGVVIGNSNYDSIESEVKSFVIDKKAVAKPTAIENLKYTGDVQLGVNFVDNVGYAKVDGSIEEVAVGEYFAMFVINSNHVWSDGDLSNTCIVNWYILEAMNRFIVDNIEIEDWVYGEEGSEPMGLVAEYGVVEYKYSSEENGVYTSAIPQNAGTYFVKGFVEGNADYGSLESMAISFVIKKKFVDKPVAKENLKYNGEVQVGLSFAINGGYTKVGGSIEEVNAGKYVAVFVLDSNHAWSDKDTSSVCEVSWEIARANNKFIINNLSIDNWEYGSEASKPNGLEAKFGVVEYLYSSSIDGVYSSSIPKDAGIYYLKGVVEESTNYVGLESETEPFKIEKKSVDKPKEVANLRYTGYLQKGVVYETDSGYIKINGLIEAINAGEYFAVFTLDSNHKWSDGDMASLYTVNWMIEKAYNFFSVNELSIDDWVYGEEGNLPKGLEAMFGDVVYKYSTSIDGVYSTALPTEAGIYYVKGTVTGNDNYVGVEGESVSFTIEKKMVDKPKAIENLVYDGSSKVGVVFETGKGYTITDGAVEKVNVGNYFAIFTLDSNHKWSDGDESSSCVVDWSIKE